MSRKNMSAASRLPDSLASSGIAWTSRNKKQKIPALEHLEGVLIHESTCLPNNVARSPQSAHGTHLSFFSHPRRRREMLIDVSVSLTRPCRKALNLTIGGLQLAHLLPITAQFQDRTFT